MSDLERSSLLVLSTAHLSPDTNVMLDTWCSTIDLSRKKVSETPTLMGATDYGWIVYALEDRDNSIPDDLWACMEYARKHHSDYILFDRDAIETEELTVYDYEEI